MKVLPATGGRRGSALPTRVDRRRRLQDLEDLHAGHVGGHVRGLLGWRPATGVATDDVRAPRLSQMRVGTSAFNTVSMRVRCSRHSASDIASRSARVNGGSAADAREVGLRRFCCDSGGSGAALGQPAKPQHFGGVNTEGGAPAECSDRDRPYGMGFPARSATTRLGGGPRGVRSSRPPPAGSASQVAPARPGSR
jgi:hypothetical protein